MQEKLLFEYAVIRVVPRVEREEFLNVGIIVFCKKSRFLQCRFHLDPERLMALCPIMDLNEIESYLHAFARICHGSKDGGPIAALDTPSRFRWLTATRSTVVQTSKVHPGLCTDLDTSLQHLYEQLVL